MNTFTKVSNKTIAQNLSLNNLSNEKWEPIQGYEGIYSISNLGRVKSLSRVVNCKNNSTAIIKDRILSQSNIRGYRRVLLLKNKFRKNMQVHRLVCLAFLKNPLKKPQVNHINGVKDDNRLENLEWVTNSENMIHAFKTELATAKWKNVFGRENPLSIKIKQLTKEGVLVKIHYGINQAGRDLNIDVSTIVNTLKGRRKSAGGYKWEYCK